jgi:hypothetical protein
LALFLERFQLRCLCEIPHLAMIQARGSPPLLLRQINAKGPAQTQEMAAAGCETITWF